MDKRDSYGVSVNHYLGDSLTYFGTDCIFLLAIHFASRLSGNLNLTEVDLINYYICMLPIHTLIPWLDFQNKL